jgi:hypothetical protein
MSFNVSRTITYLVSVFVFFFVFFFASASQANACSVAPINIRTSAGSDFRLDLSAQSNWYDEDNVPFVYLDIQTSNCDQDTLQISIYGLHRVTGGLSLLQLDSNHVVSMSTLSAVQSFVEDTNPSGHFSYAFQPSELRCYGGQFPDCLFVFIVSDQEGNVLRISGNLASRLTASEASYFIETVTDGDISPILPQASCQFPYTGNGYYLKHFFGSCLPQHRLLMNNTLLDLRVSEYNQSVLGLNINFPNPLPQAGANAPTFYMVGFPGLLFECDGSCDLSLYEGPWVSKGPIPFGSTHPEDGNPPVNVSGLPENYELEYAPLAPLPFPGLDGGGTPNLATYLQGIFRMLLIVAVVLSVIMIVIAGFQYVASSANPQGKGEARKRLSGALIGLVLALGSWLLLDTVNPNFASNLSISIPMVSLTVDQQLYSDYEQLAPSSGQAFVLNGTFDNPQTSPGLDIFLSLINEQNPITNITVNTSAASMIITSAANNSVTIPVTGIGSNGVAEIGQGVPEDRKTPKGSWLTTSRTRVAQNMNDAQLSQGGFSMGPAFIATNISSSDGQIRGIWIHGNQNNNPGPTMGCVRLSNDDVLALARKIQPNVPLIIQ